MSLNFQYGEFINQSPAWLELGGFFLTFAALGAAFVLYYMQRWDNEKDAYEVFIQGLCPLYKGTKHTLKTLENFKDGLEKGGDSFTNPILSSSFNAYLIDRIDLTHLHRAYKSKGKLRDFRRFLLDTDFIKGYHEYFSGEISYVRDNFLAKETIYKKWQLLPTNIFFEVSENANDSFKRDYQIWNDNLRGDVQTVGPDGIINRTRLVHVHIRNLRDVSYKYIKTDNAIANKVNQLCNEVIAARDDMDAINAAMLKVISSDIETVEKIKKNLLSLHPPLKGACLKCCNYEPFPNVCNI